MSADAEKSELQGHLNMIVSGLAIMFTVAAIALGALWLSSFPTERNVLANGAVELRESPVALILSVLLCVCTVFFGIWMLARSMGLWRIVGRVSLFVGLGIGAFAMGFMATRSRLVFDQAGVSVMAPPWFGGEARAKLVYSEIEWLGTTERIYWKQRRHVSTVFHRGEKPTWYREATYQYWIKRKDAEVTTFDLGWPVRGGWSAILKAAQTAGVTVKPVERIEMPREAD